MLTPEESPRRDGIDSQWTDYELLEETFNSIPKSHIYDQGPSIVDKERIYSALLTGYMGNICRKAFEANGVDGGQVILMGIKIIDIENTSSPLVLSTFKIRDRSARPLGLWNGRIFELKDGEVRFLLFTPFDTDIDNPGSFSFQNSQPKFSSGLMMSKLALKSLYNDAKERLNADISTEHFAKSPLLTILFESVVSKFAEQTSEYPGYIYFQKDRFTEEGHIEFMIEMGKDEHSQMHSYFCTIFLDKYLHLGIAVAPTSFYVLYSELPSLKYL